MVGSVVSVLGGLELGDKGKGGVEEFMGRGVV